MRLARKGSRPAALSLSLHLCIRALLGLSTAAVATFAAVTPALAEPATSKTIAIHIEGPNADEIRDDILELVPGSLTVASPDAFTKALRGAGQTKPFGDTLLFKRGRDKELARIRKAASKASIDAVIVGISRTNKRKQKELYLLYVDQIPGDLAVDKAVPVGGSRDERKRELDALLGPTLAELAPKESSDDEGRKKADDEAAKPEGGGGEEKKDDADEEPKAERKPHEIGSALFAIELGFELTGRTFEYSDLVTEDSLLPYDVPPGVPTIAVQGEVYPLAATGIPVLKGLGITGGFAQAFGLTSKLGGYTGDVIPTSYRRIHAGLRERLTFGDGRTVLGISAGLRLLTFSFDAPAELAGAVPDVAYVLGRGGVDARVPIGPVALAAGFDFLAPLSSGDDVYDRIAGASVLGIGAMGGVLVPLGSGVEARLLVEYTRLFSSFSPAIGDPYVAGGALDEYLGIRIAGAYIY